MDVLFLHQNFPGQFIHVAEALRAEGHDVRAVSDVANRRSTAIPILHYSAPAPCSDTTHPLAKAFESRVARGEAVATTLHLLRQSGFSPDVIVAHLGWGESLFVKDIWPAAKLVAYAEFYYTPRGVDSDFDPEFRKTEPLDIMREQMRVRSKNAHLVLAMADADYGVSPTRWQGLQFPRVLQPKIAILHEGIDTDLARPAMPDADLCLILDGSGSDCVRLGQGDEIITFVSRSLEPYRGYHIFMRALPEILRARPKAHAVIVGGEGQSYGPAPLGAQSWKQRFFKEVEAHIPRERVHFVGRIAHADLIKLFQISSVHVYLTYPFVLSWSLLEAMSAGALIVASRTAPVEEVVRNGENGLLFDFFDVPSLERLVTNVLAQPEAYSAIKWKARKTIIEGYDLKSYCLPRWLTFLHKIAGQK